IDTAEEKQDIEESHVAKVLVENPKSDKPKKRGLSIFVNVYSFIIFMVSGVAINMFLSNIIELIVDLKGLPYAIFNLVFLCFHILAFLTLLRHANLTFKRKK
ncbi:MAG: hypothetical protein IJO77_05125, partial [Oscillospiraceae bacterium]|nr:hypothetical protein [Oscillospiraceae bacterium]